MNWIDPLGLAWQFSVGINGTIGGNPFLIMAPFVGGGVRFGVTSDGQLFMQVTASGQMGFGAFACVGGEFGASYNQCSVKPGMNTQQQLIGSANLGFGPTVGGSVEGSPGVEGTPFDGGASFGASGGGGRFGAGFGLQISGGISTTTTFATPPLW